MVTLYYDFDTLIYLFPAAVTVLPNSLFGKHVFVGYRIAHRCPIFDDDI